MAGANAEISSGIVIDGRVRLTRRVGRGGMGEVWAADHLTLGIEVAVKLLSPALAADAEAVSRFSREAQAAARIKSPHVVQIHDHGVYEGTPYFVMELLEGETLAARLQREQRLDPSEALSIVAQACKALGRAHELGIVHRDLKPANLFLTRAGNETFVKVLDFGIVKLLGATPLTALGTSIGTASYMSPEQVSGSSSLDQRSDLFTLAVVSYRMLTGKLPFSGDSPVDTMVAITQGEFLPPSAHRPELPRSLDRWFASALAVSPAQRPQSAGQLADSLAAALRSDTSLAFAATARASAVQPSAYARIAPTLVSATAGAASVRSGSTPAAQSSRLQASFAAPRPQSAAHSNARLVLAAVALGVALLGALVIAAAVLWLAYSSPVAPRPGASVAATSTAIPGATAQAPQSSASPSTAASSAAATASASAGAPKLSSGAPKVSTAAPKLWKSPPATTSSGKGSTTGPPKSSGFDYGY